MRSGRPVSIVSLGNHREMLHRDRFPYGNGSAPVRAALEEAASPNSVAAGLSLSLCPAELLYLATKWCCLLFCAIVFGPSLPCLCALT